MTNAAMSSHPSAEKLRQFGLGELDHMEAALVEDHVYQCEACSRTLRDVGTDTFINALRMGARAVPLDGATVGASDARRVLAADGARTAAEAATVAEPPPELSSHPRYRVLSLLGVGGMGAVYKAEHRLMERMVALKVMSKALVGSAAGIERFRREFKASARLAHPNIVAGYDAEQAGELHFLVMEYVEGTDLARLLAERGPLPVAQACGYISQAAIGLQHAHEHGMIHRDIKPHNLMCTPDGTVKILDFGLARLAAEAGSVLGGMTGQGALLGTVDYLAPEQADDARQADIRSDIYSLGCTLYHLLSGQAPFPRGTLVQRIMAHTKNQAPLLESIRPDLPPGLSAVLKRMMAKSPSDRYQRPAEVAIALGPFARSTAVLDPVPWPKKPLSKRSIRLPRRRWPVVAAAAAVLLALASLLAGLAVYRIQTDNGELVITTDNPDVEVIIKQNGNLVRVIDTKTNKEVRLRSGSYDLELGGKVEGMTVTPDKVTIRRAGKAIATVERRLPASAPPAKPALLHAIPFVGKLEGVSAHIWQTDIAPDDRLFLGAGETGGKGSVRIFDVATGKQVQEFDFDEDTAGRIPCVHAAQFVPGGKYVAVAYDLRKDVYLWDLATGKLARKLVGHSEADPGFAVSPNGKRLLSWAADKSIRLWDVDSGQELRKLEGHADKAAGTFSPDGKQVLTFSPDKTLRLWDVDSGRELKKLEGHTEACTGSFSPDGKQALSYGPDGTIRLWDLATAQELRRFEGSKAAVMSAGFVAKGRLVVARTDEHSADTTLRTWETATGKLLGEIDYGRYGNNTWTITASPDGRLALMQVKSDASVRVLELPDGKEIHRFDRCRGARFWSFTRDGTLAVAGSFRNGMFVFRLPAPPRAEKVRR